MILGASGSGKSTLLRAVAGLQPLDAGHVALDGVDVTARAAAPARRGPDVPGPRPVPAPRRRRQRRLRPADAGSPGARRPRRGSPSCSTLVGLPGTERRAIQTLSGGEQQRVALARSLAPGAVACSCSTSRSARSTGRCASGSSSSCASSSTSSHLTVVAVTHDQRRRSPSPTGSWSSTRGRVLQTGTPAAVWGAPDQRAGGAAPRLHQRGAGRGRRTAACTPRGATSVPPARTPRPCSSGPRACALDPAGPDRGDRGRQHLRRRSGAGARRRRRGPGPRGRGRRAPRPPPWGRRCGCGSTRPPSRRSLPDRPGSVDPWRHPYDAESRSRDLQSSALHADHLSRAPPPPRRPRRRPRGRRGGVGRARAGPGRRAPHHASRPPPRPSPSSRCPPIEIDHHHRSRRTPTIPGAVRGAARGAGAGRARHGARPRARARRVRRAGRSHRAPAAARGRGRGRRRSRPPTRR